MTRQWHEPGVLHRLRRRLYPGWLWRRYSADLLERYEHRNDPAPAVLPSPPQPVDLTRLDALELDVARSQAVAWVDIIAHGDHLTNDDVALLERIADHHEAIVAEQTRRAELIESAERVAHAADPPWYRPPPRAVGHPATYGRRLEEGTTTPPAMPAALALAKLRALTAAGVARSRRPNPSGRSTS